MNQKVLTKKFFRKNPLERMSPAQIAYIFIEKGGMEDEENRFNEYFFEKMEPEKREKIMREKAIIAQSENAEQLVKLMRSDYNTFSHIALRRKAIEMQETVMPLLLRRLQTSFQDGFVECAIQILAYAQVQYVEQLKAIYHNIRNPYAQSMVCLAFGVKQFEDMIPLLLDEYYRMQREYPEEIYEQGPLFALYLLHGMI